jgi:hypothetical protein
MESLSGGPEQNPVQRDFQQRWKTFMEGLLPNRSNAELAPTAESSGAARIERLKRDLVAELCRQDGPFWQAIREIRTEWGIQPRTALPSEDDPHTVQPIDQLSPFFKKGRRNFKEWRKLDKRWHENIASLRTSFVPNLLWMGGGWHEFFGACVMCDPPKNRLLEFAEYGRIYPSPFWPPFEGDPDEIDTSKLHSMIAPPIECVWKRGPGASYEDGEQFMEYKIIVDEHTTEADVVRAFRGIKAAYNLRNPGGRPPIDKLTAIQCAVLYDDYNGADPDDGRFWRWTYKKLAAKFRTLGVKNERSAVEHVKRGRALLRKFHST